MENVDINSLKGFLAPSVIKWLTEGQQLTSGLLGDCVDTDEFFEGLPEVELAELEHSPSKAADTTSEFKTASDEELTCLIENNSNLNTKRTTST